MDWTHVVQDLGPPLTRYFSASFSRQAAPDLVQEVFIRLLKKSRSGAFDSSQGTLRMYAFGIAHFVRLEALKARNASAEALVEWGDSEESRGAGADQMAEQNDEARRLRCAMEKLPETQRQILLLLIDRDLSLEEIATIVGAPLGTVKSHVHRAKVFLKEKLSKQMERSVP